MFVNDVSFRSNHIIDKKTMYTPFICVLMKPKLHIVPLGKGISINPDYTFKDVECDVETAQVIEKYNIKRTKHPDKKVIFVNRKRDKI